MSSRSIRSFIKVALLAVLAAGSASCESEPSTSPSAPGIPVTESFIVTLEPSGQAFYSFSMARAGTVSLTLISVTGPSVPGDALFPVGVGIPIGQLCSAGVDAAISPGSSPQYTVAKELGVYCVRIGDNARLGASAAFVLNITHPK